MDLYHHKNKTASTPIVNPISSSAGAADKKCMGQPGHISMILSDQTYRTTSLLLPYLGLR